MQNHDGQNIIITPRYNYEGYEKGIHTRYGENEQGEKLKNVLFQRLLNFFLDL